MRKIKLLGWEDVIKLNRDKKKLYELKRKAILVYLMQKSHLLSRVVVYVGVTWATYPIKEQLKKLGFKWDAGARAWKMIIVDIPIDEWKAHGDEKEEWLAKVIAEKFSEIVKKIAEIASEVYVDTRDNLTSTDMELVLKHVDFDAEPAGFAQ